MLYTEVTAVTAVHSWKTLPECGAGIPESGMRKLSGN